MPQTGPQPSASRRALPITVFALFVIMLLPAGWLGWVAWFEDAASIATAPISHPARMLGNWIDPARTREIDAEKEELATALEDAQFALEQTRERIVELEEQIAELQGGIRLGVDRGVTPVLTPVVSNSSDLSSRELVVKRGESDGVTVNTVATVRSVQLVGRVVRTSPRSARVRPITDRAARRIEGRVMFDTEGNGLRCSLRPAGDGTLVGDVGDVVGPRPIDASEIEVGMEVRLDDDTWPRSSRMLLIGLVEDIEDDPKTGLRKIVTVRPTVELHRVSEVILRIVEEDS